jgi:hypothetical protein
LAAIGVAQDETAPAPVYAIPGPGARQQTWLGWQPAEGVPNVIAPQLYTGPPLSPPLVLPLLLLVLPPLLLLVLLPESCPPPLAVPPSSPPPPELLELLHAAKAAKPMGSANSAKRRVMGVLLVMPARTTASFTVRYARTRGD